ncbi:hypothetical protein Q5O14_01965 [Eubacteriaceae bacterium ES2]|nr:hypothetical protein Q5O14_01965 [Eubacteriaceae bacterium ES2]
MNDAKHTILREKRLHQIVAWTRENSPYYSQLYKDIGTDFQLSDLPPVNKLDLMAHWDDWVTDKTISLSEINEFMGNIDNIGRKFKGKYLIFTTSGSTGNPLVALFDSTTNNMMSALNLTRSFARKNDLYALIRHGGKTIGVFATGGFYLGNSSVRARLIKMPWKKRQMA